MASSKVAVVTGGNKGIGLAIVQALCKQFKGDVYLTARDPRLGEASVKKLQEEEGLSPHFHQLDITDLQSIRKLKDFMKKEYGGIDVLINNAGIAFQAEEAKRWAPLLQQGSQEPSQSHRSPPWHLTVDSGLPVADATPFHIQAEVTLKTNFFATRDVCTELLPLIKPHGRVVNVSSMAGQFALSSCSKDLQEKFRSDTITEDELAALMEKFVEDTKKGIHTEEGWPNTAYGVSKIGVTVLSMIQARKMTKQRGTDGILLNTCCPGWVRTDLGGDSAPKTPDQGAETPVYLALLPSDAQGPHGKLINKKQVKKW